ncbi:LacI family DNA-binding transcriptional regulator [Enterobacter cancerogenus]|uniref:LacI family DNA-binding transcriptional regulator n=1 Tax=Enterobacter cancerogenus TaxID=69218 RepID=UPI000536634A|nr:LacI family DNA-binding transcriptional regulator [Enterobacter cancerogenus]KGT92148.1 LacI family transcriptional regulator [Enterobacter cancerogenus]
MSDIKKTTLDQIAAAAGVSLSTVDRVMNRRGGVSPAREAKVLEWANKLNVDRVLFRGYLPMLRVAILMQSPKNPFYRGLRNAFADIGATLSDMRLNCFIHYLDLTKPQGTIKQIHQIASVNDAMIVVCPNDPDVAEALRQISTKTPVVTLVTDIPTSGRIAYVGPDNRQMGRAAGELMGRFCGSQGGEVLVVLGMQHMIGHEEREMGFRSVLRERFTQFAISETLESGEDQTRAGEVVRRALQNNPNIRGIYNVSAGNTNITQAIRSLGLEQQMVLITHELTTERRRMLREGVIDVIIDQNPHEEARRALEIIAVHFNRLESDKPPGSYTPFNIYIRENCPPESEFN